MFVGEIKVQSLQPKVVLIDTYSYLFSRYSRELSKGSPPICSELGWALIQILCVSMTRAVPSFGQNIKEGGRVTFGEQLGVTKSKKDSQRLCPRTLLGRGSCPYKGADPSGSTNPDSVRRKVTKWGIVIKQANS